MPSENLKDFLSPALNQSLADEVVVRIRRAILNGQFAPGEPLRERYLAEIMQVSRGPIREALAILESEGLVITRRNRGAFVARLSREDVDEIYTLRMGLERIAVQQITRRQEANDLDEMQAILDELMASSPKDATEQQLAEHDIRFHEALCRASRHKRLFTVWSSLRSSIHIFLLSRIATNRLQFYHEVVRNHHNLLAVLRRGDETAAVAAIEDHIQDAYAHVVSIYDNDSIPSEAALDPMETTRTSS